MTRRLNLWLAVLLMIVGIPFYWYLLDAGTGDARAKPVTMTQLRALAASLPGPAPTALRSETLATRSVTRDMLAAGSGLRPAPIVLRAYTLVVPGERPVVIDAGTTRAAAEERDFETFDEGARQRVALAARNAGRLILLNAMPLRNGGLPAGRVPPGAVESLPGHGPRVVAPGVVVVPLAGLEPGATLVYVRLADGRELLFAGAVARLHASWQEVRPPARLTTRNESATYRPELASWLMTINALHRQAPQMTVVPAHEPEDVAFATHRFSD